MFNKKSNKDLGRVCLRSSIEGTSIAVSKRVGEKLQLQHCEYFSADDLQREPSLIKNFIQSNDIVGAQCSIILASDEYQMLLTDAPDVPNHEICDALWWKVKDLVAFDIDNAQIDYLELPEDGAKHQGRKIYAFIGDKSKIAAKVAWAEDLGLTVSIIEAPETALLHLVSGLCSDLVGTSILYLDAEQSLLMLLSQNSMYLARTLQYSYLDRMEAVALDLQRSMDYYESQIGKPPCLKVIVLPQQDPDSPMMQTLLNNIGVEITSMDINEVINCNQTLSIDTQQRCLLAISGAMRIDRKQGK